MPTTHLTTTTRAKPAPTRHPATKVYWLADDFSEPTIDYGLWGPARHGTGVQVVQQNGQAVFSIGADVTYDPNNGNVDQHYGTECFLTGDFDAQIDFDLLSWPAADGVYVELGAYFPPPNEAFWSITRTGRSVGGGSEGYGSLVGSDNGWVQTADMRGALRISRKRGLLMTSYRYKGAWVVLAESLEPGPAALVISLSTNPHDFGNQAASIAFDNFQATATSVDCHGAPLPPQRPHG